MRIDRHDNSSGPSADYKVSRRPTRILLLTMLLMMDAPGCRTDVDDLKSANLLIPGTELPSAICERLQKAGWRDRVGDRIGVWVSVEHQKLVGIEGTRIAFVYPCSTAERGTGSRENSYKTPLGWHYIDERIGGGAPEGAVFKSRVYQNEVWKPGDETEKDLVLTRIMWLRGLEEGRNVGPGIDSHDRYIYIHGTPAEDKIGTPASHGCIRLKNRDVIEVFDRTRAGTRVLITKW